MDDEDERRDLGIPDILNGVSTGGKDTARDAKTCYRKLIALAKEVKTWVENDELVDIDLVARHVRAIT